MLGNGHWHTMVALFGAPLAQRSISISCSLLLPLLYTSYDTIGFKRHLISVI